MIKLKGHIFGSAKNLPDGDNQIDIAKDGL
jgi:hypothetical protein